MEQDKIQVCSKCGGVSYTQKVTDNINIEMCLTCGYTHNSLMMEEGLSENQFFLEQMEKFPKIYRDITVIDGQGKVWVPSYTEVEGKGVIFAISEGPEDFVWAAVPHVKLKKFELKMYPEKYKNKKYKPEMKKMKKFDKYKFYEALDFLGLLEDTLKK